MALTKENVYLDIGSERVKFICHEHGAGLCQALIQCTCRQLKKWTNEK